MSNAPAAPLPPLMATTVEYRWTFLIPEWVVEPRRVGMHVLAPAMQPARVDYDFVEWTTERRQFGRVPEFHCKYSDLGLPNECRTTWRDVYVEVPVPVIRRDYVDVDVPRWSRRDWHTVVDVPRLVWKEETLIVSLPALAAPHP